MVNLLDIRLSIFNPQSVIADVYKGSHKVCKTTIKPFRKEMERANNIIVFIDDNYNITGGQIGLYDLDNGLRVEMF